MSKKHVEAVCLPNNEAPQGKQVLLHSCCAPCSSAVLEWMVDHGMRPTVFFSNSNIYPKEEFLHRRDEIEKHLKALGIAFVEDEYNHSAWRDYVRGLEHEPERGHRCEKCFQFRLARAAHYAAEHGFHLLTTTLASSRWKDLNQVNEAGTTASQQVEGVTFWPQNWRKGGLQERRNTLLHYYNFYNQLYCGCEFSLSARTASENTKEQTLVQPKTNS